MRKSSIAKSLLSLAMLLTPLAATRAAELKVLAGGSMTESLKELAPQFSARPGTSLISTSTRRRT